MAQHASGDNNEATYLDPTSDPVYKGIFCNEDTILPLQSLIGAIAVPPAGEEIITNLRRANPEIIPTAVGRTGLVDSRVDSDKRRYIVEMQKSTGEDGYEGIKDRVQFYVTALFGMQSKSTTKRNKNPAVLIMFKVKGECDNETIVSTNRVLDDRTLKCNFPCITIIMVDLERPESKKDKDLSPLAKQWIYFFKHAKGRRSPPDDVTDEGLLEAYSILAHMSNVPDMRNKLAKQEERKQERNKTLNDFADEKMLAERQKYHGKASKIMQVVDLNKRKKLWEEWESKMNLNG